MTRSRLTPRDPFLHNAVARLVGEMLLGGREGFTLDDVFFYRDLLVLEAYGASRREASP